MENILAVDDDLIILSLLECIIPKEQYATHSFSNGKEALHSIDTIEYDLIISDLLMPELDGRSFFLKVKDKKPDIPFIFLTAQDDIETVVQLMKLGADDYIKKPIKKEILLAKIDNAIKEKKQEALILQIKADEIAEKTEQEGIFSWKDLYSVKDSNQANQLINFLSRNFEQCGSFMWLDILKQKVSSSDENADGLYLQRNFLDLIIESTKYISKIIHDLTYVNSLLFTDFPMEMISFSKFTDLFRNYYESEMIPIAVKYKKRSSLNINNIKDNYLLNINTDSLLRICKELLFNSIKYSPEWSKIIIFTDLIELKNNKFMELSFWNYPIETINKNKHGERITGIPYEYSEAVFELFYTLDKFPTRIPEEEWSQGIGLYVARNLLRKMDSEITAKNIIMHTAEKPVPFVKVSILLPVSLQQ